ncbi:MAG: DUF481 domain-containing protein, partial [Planctomycetota bacterium]
MSPARLPLALACLLAASPLARADEVLLASGERLLGKVVSVADGKMTFESAGIGTVTLDLAKVKTFTTEGAVEIRFKDGTVVNQPVQGSEEGKFAIGPTGVLGPRTLPLSEIASINPPKVETKWTGSATAGYTVTRGNSETDSTSIVLDAVRRSEQDRLSFRGEYAAARQTVEEPDPTTPGATVENRETTQRLITGALKYDYF